MIKFELEGHTIEASQGAPEQTGWTGTVGVAQSTCPLVTAGTLRHVVDAYRRDGYDWAITGCPAPHIMWHRHTPITPRVNRQDLYAHPDTVWRESGALQLMSATFALTGQGTRDIIPIPESEALDIDTPADLAAARMLLGRKTILFAVTVGREVGTGHFWRCLRLTEALAHHRVVWKLVGDPPQWATDLLDTRGVTYSACYGWHVDLLVCDALDAAEALVPTYAAEGVPTVVLEHDGPACRFADLVVDEFQDSRWTVLRPEFLALPEKQMEPGVQNIVVTFGGTDPAGLSARVGGMLGYGCGARVRILQGPGAAPIGDRAGLATVVTDAHMADELRNATLVVTGQGRTVAEAVACGTPVISLAQNERESRHAKLPGVLYLGLWAAVSDEALLRTVCRLLDRPGLRAEMARTASASVDGKGVERIVFEVEKLLRGL